MGPFSNNWTTQQVEAVLARGASDELLHVPIVVSMNANDFGVTRAEDICVGLAANPDPHVRGNAIKGLGHIARVTGQFNRADSIACVKSGLSDKDELVRSHASDASSDIFMFTGLKISE